MKSFLSIIALSITLPLMSYIQKTEYDLENEKYLNFIAAIERSSTFSYFTVIKVKNLNTGEIKNICTKGNFIAGALHIESNIGYDNLGQQRVIEIAKLKKNRYFEFKSNKALDNISFFTYKTSLLKRIKTKYNFDKVVGIIKQTGAFSLRLSDDEMKAFAHILFDRGFLTGENNCAGGTLQYVDRNEMMQ